MALKTVLPALLAFFTYPYISKIFWSYLIRKYTFVNELRIVANPRPDGRKIEGTVVIAGGGGGGLIASGILSKHFTRIIVIEPEQWVNTEEGVRYEKPRVEVVDGLRTPYRKRRRVPQFLSLHNWPSFVLTLMRQLFPRWDTHVKQNGGIIEPLIFKSHFSGIPLQDPTHLYPLGLPSAMFISRSLFEPLLRFNVKALSSPTGVKDNNQTQVEFLMGSVTGVIPDKFDSSRIGSVEYKLNGEDEVKREDVMLFIDCAGPSHLGLKWLSSAGFLSPDSIDKLTQKYNMKMKASTSYWPLTESLRTGVGIPSGGWPYVSFPCPGSDDRMFGFGRLESDQVLILCCGWGDHIPMPRTLSEIREFIQGMNLFSPIPEWVWKMLDDLREHENEAVYDIYNLPPPSRVLYTKTPSGTLPPNFLAIGDASTALNPVFAQGFAKVCMGSLILDSMLRKLSSESVEENGLPRRFAEEFFKQLEDRVDEPLWSETKTQDYGWPTTIPIQGESLSDGRFMRWYGRNMLFASVNDQSLASTLWHVDAFIYPGICLLAPSVWFKVLRQWWSGRIPLPS